MIQINKNKIPFFTVIICTHNRLNLLPRAIESLLNQTEHDWECLIVDDGSTDGTSNYALEFCRQDFRFRYIYQKNRGVGAAKNAGVLASAGIYCTFLDSDDEYKPNHLEIRKEALLQNPEVDLLHSTVEIIGNEYVPDMNDKSKLIHINECIIGGTFVFRRETGVELGGFPVGIYGDDSAFYHKALNLGFEVASIDFPTYIYHRETEDSICNDIIKNNDF